MIDARKVIAYVKLGNYHPNWRVYYGIGNYGWAITWGILAVLFFILFVGLILSGTQSGLYFLVLAIPCLMAAYYTRNEAYNKDHSILVILPEGVIQCYDGNPNRLSCLYFSSIHRMELARETNISGFDGDISSSTDYWLDVYRRDGTYHEWVVSERFGDTTFMYKSILAAYNYYKYYNQF